MKTRSPSASPPSTTVNGLLHENDTKKLMQMISLIFSCKRVCCECCKL